MKKLLTVVLCLVLALSTATMMGCSKSTFDGNYQEADVATVEQMAAEIAQAEGGEELDYDSGIRIIYDMKVTGDMEMEMNMDMKTIAVENELQAEVKVKAKGIEGTGEDAIETVETAVYFANGYMYQEVQMEPNTDPVKMKIQMPIEDMIEWMFDEMMSMGPDVEFSLSAILEDLDEGVKLYVDDGEDAKKIKLEFEDAVSDVKSKVVFVYDAEYNLTAMLMEMEMTESEGDMSATMKMSFKAEAWSGSISLPTDLDTYIDPTQM